MTWVVGEVPCCKEGSEDRPGGAYVRAGYYDYYDSGYGEFVTYSNYRGGIKAQNIMTKGLGAAGVLAQGGGIDVVGEIITKSLSGAAQVFVDTFGSDKGINAGNISTDGWCDCFVSAYDGYINVTHVIDTRQRYDQEREIICDGSTGAFVRAEDVNR